MKLLNIIPNPNYEITPCKLGTCEKKKSSLVAELKNFV